MSTRCSRRSKGTKKPKRNWRPLGDSLGVGSVASCSLQPPAFMFRPALHVTYYPSSWGPLPGALWPPRKNTRTSHSNCKKIVALVFDPFAKLMLFCRRRLVFVTVAMVTPPPPPPPCAPPPAPPPPPFPPPPPDENPLERATGPGENQTAALPEAPNVWRA